MILNLTGRPLTERLRQLGVVDPSPEEQDSLQRALSLVTSAEWNTLFERLQEVCAIAQGVAIGALPMVMIDDAAPRERELACALMYAGFATTFAHALDPGFNKALYEEAFYEGYDD